MKLWWLSFCDAKRPEGQQFLGAVIVPARGFREALAVSWILEINPGGECQGFQVNYAPGANPIPEYFLERLLNQKEIDKVQRAVEG